MLWAKSGYMMIMDIWYIHMIFCLHPESRPRILVGDADAPVEALEPKWKETLASLGCQQSQASCRHAALLLAALLRLWPRCGIMKLSQDFCCGKRLQIFECGECQGNRRQEMTQEYIWVGELVTRSLTQMDRRFRLSSCSLNGPRDRGNGFPQSQKIRRYEDAMWPYMWQFGVEIRRGYIMWYCSRDLFDEVGTLMAFHWSLRIKIISNLFAKWWSIQKFVDSWHFEVFCFKDECIKKTLLRMAPWPTSQCFQRETSGCGITWWWVHLAWCACRYMAWRLGDRWMLN